MHRHGYQGTKFGRERDQRKALLKSLAEALILHGAIKTTLPKAKATVPYVEKLITKAKKGDLHSRRSILSSLQTVEAAHRLVDEIAPKLTGRTSGHLRVVRDGNRRGDNAEMARVSFVDDLGAAPVAAVASAAPTKQHHDLDVSKGKTVAKNTVPGAKKAVKATDSARSNKPAVNVRKTGER